ncbi:hypothetical protein AYI69_g3406 [Smittium culicis]|uniref:Uncharacterized protein n=1 Tax=Smittium culicis TaxID=133412 RepID=A0A1R1YJS8_9FUNG|nr:hypothetical protein AYI69_g3406 [Smittium culicis]
MDEPTSSTDNELVLSDSLLINFFKASSSFFIHNPSQTSLFLTHSNLFPYSDSPPDPAPPTIPRRRKIKYSPPNSLNAPTSDTSSLQKTTKPLDIQNIHSILTKVLSYTGFRELCENHRIRLKLFQLYNLFFSPLPFSSTSENHKNVVSTDYSYILFCAAELADIVWTIIQTVPDKTKLENIKSSLFSFIIELKTYLALHSIRSELSSIPSIYPSHSPRYHLRPLKNTKSPSSPPYKHSRFLDSKFKTSFINNSNSILNTLSIKNPSRRAAKSFWLNSPQLSTYDSSIKSRLSILNENVPVLFSCPKKLNSFLNSNFPLSNFIESIISLTNICTLDSTNNFDQSLSTAYFNRSLYQFAIIDYKALSQIFSTDSNEFLFISSLLKTPENNHLYNNKNIKKFKPPISHQSNPSPSPLIITKKSKNSKPHVLKPLVTRSDPDSYVFTGIGNPFVSNRTPFSPPGNAPNLVSTPPMQIGDNASEKVISSTRYVRNSLDGDVACGGRLRRNRDFVNNNNHNSDSMPDSPLSTPISKSNASYFQYDDFTRSRSNTSDDPLSNSPDSIISPLKSIHSNSPTIKFSQAGINFNLLQNGLRATENISEPSNIHNLNVSFLKPFGFQTNMNEFNDYKPLFPHHSITPQNKTTASNQHPYLVPNNDIFASNLLMSTPKNQVGSSAFLSTQDQKNVTCHLVPADTKHDSNKTENQNKLTD